MSQKKIAQKAAKITKGVGINCASTPCTNQLGSITFAGVAVGYNSVDEGNFVRIFFWSPSAWKSLEGSRLRLLGRCKQRPSRAADTPTRVNIREAVQIPPLKGDERRSE